jgi:hypothetical protein
MEQMSRTACPVMRQAHAVLRVSTPNPAQNRDLNLPGPNLPAFCSVKLMKKTIDAPGVWHYQAVVNDALNLRLLLNALLPSRVAVEV